MKPFQMDLPLAFHPHLPTNFLHPVLELTSLLAFPQNYTMLPVFVSLSKVLFFALNLVVPTSWKSYPSSNFKTLRIKLYRMTTAVQNFLEVIK
jgi:hypothetical protein